MRRSGSWVLQQARREIATDVPCRWAELSAAELRQREQPACPPRGGPVRRFFLCAAAIAVFSVPDARAQQAPAAKATDLDDFMAKALLRRDTDRKNLSDYVLDEVEEFEVLGPGRVPVARLRREYTWYVRDGMHVRS